MLLHLVVAILLLLGALAAYEAAHRCHIGKGGFLCKLWKASV